MQDTRKLFLGICLMFFFAFLMFGYESNASLEKTDYIMTLGFDYQDGKRIVYYESPTLKKDAADSVLGNSQKIKKIQVNRYQEFEEGYMQVSDKAAEFHHLKAVVVGEKLVQNKDEFVLFLEFLNEQNVIAENVLFFVDGSEKGVFDEERKGSIGAYLENLTDYEMKDQKNQTISVAKLLASFYNENQTLYIPVVDSVLAVKGYEILCSGIWEAYVDEKDGHILFLGNGWKTKDEFYVQDVIGEGEVVSEKESFSVEIKRVSRELFFENGKDIVHVNCKLSVEGIGKDSNGKEIQDYEQRISYSKAFEELLQLSLEEQMRKWQGMDVLNTFYEVSNKNREVWKQYRHQYEAYKQKMSVNLDVQVELKD